MDTKFRDSACKPLGPMIDKEIEKMKNLVVIKDNKAKIYLKESTKSMKYDLCEKKHLLYLWIYKSISQWKTMTQAMKK